MPADMDNREAQPESRQDDPREESAATNARRAPDLGEEEAPRYATLADYVRVLRRRWWIVVAVAAACAAGAFLYFSTRSVEYEARARIAFQPLATEGLPEVALVMPLALPLQAQAVVELARSPKVARRAKH